MNSVKHLVLLCMCICIHHYFKDSIFLVKKVFNFHSEHLGHVIYVQILMGFCRIACYGSCI